MNFSLINVLINQFYVVNWECLHVQISKIYLSFFQITKFKLLSYFRHICPFRRIIPFESGVRRLNASSSVNCWILVGNEFTNNSIYLCARSRLCWTRRYICSVSVFSALLKSLIEVKPFNQCYQLSI